MESLLHCHANDEGCSHLPTTLSTDSQDLGTHSAQKMRLIILELFRSWHEIVSYQQPRTFRKKFNKLAFLFNWEARKKLRYFVLFWFWFISVLGWIMKKNMTSGKWYASTSLKIVHYMEKIPSYSSSPERLHSIFILFILTLAC